MAISFVGSAANSTNNGNDLTFGMANLRDSANNQPTLQQGDLVVVAYAIGGTADFAMSTTSSGWTTLDELFVDDTNDTNLIVFYKVMGSTPDTSIVLKGNGSPQNGLASTMFAFRGVDTTTPIDVFTPGTHSVTGRNTYRPDPPSITPSASGAWIVVTGAGAAGTGADYTNAGDLSSTTNHFRTTNQVETVDISIGTGIKTDWSSGAFDAGAWTGGTVNAADSWASIVFSLKPGIETQNLTPSFFNETDTFYVPVVERSPLLPSLFADGDTFFAPTASSAYTLSPDLFSDADTFFSGTVAVINNLQPSLFTNSNSFPSATVTPGTITLTPSLFTDADTFFTPIVSSLVTLTPSLFSDADTFFSATITPGPVTLQPSLFPNTNIFYSPSVSSFNIQPNLFTNTNTFYSATIGTTYSVAPNLFTDTDTFFSPSVGTFYSLTTPAFVNNSSFFTATISQITPLNPTLFTNTNTFYSPNVIGSSQFVVQAEIFKNQVGDAGANNQFFFHTIHPPIKSPITNVDFAIGRPIVRTRRSR